jgi:hypothetical protein
MWNISGNAVPTAINGTLPLIERLIGASHDRSLAFSVKFFKG